MKGPRFILAAGGTGGHLTPALALAEGLRTARPEAEILFIGAGRPLEETILGPGGWARETLKTSGFLRRSFGQKVKALGQALAATAAARKIIRRFRPDVVIGAGGYVSGPVGLAAWLSRVPLMLLEPNAHPGLTNRLLGRLAALVMVGFDGAARFFPAARVRWGGFPLRSDIAALHGRERHWNHERVVLVLGGSQGAARINALAAETFQLLKQRNRCFRVIHQTGAGHEARCSETYAAAGINSETAPFFQDMARVYAESDLAVARAGAATVAELAAAKLPAVLIPFPGAAEDHQTANARSLAEGGAALLLPETGLTSDVLAERLGGLIDDTETLARMSRAAGEAACLSAEAAMVEAALELAVARK